jgi:hypothetical protein
MQHTHLIGFEPSKGLDRDYGPRLIGAIVCGGIALYNVVVITPYLNPTRSTTFT